MATVARLNQINRGGKLTGLFLDFLLSLQNRPGGNFKHIQEPLDVCFLDGFNLKQEYQVIK